MNQRTARTVALSALVVSLALSAAALVFLALTHSARVAPGFGFRGFPAIFAVLFGTVGALIVSRRPRNVIGWLMVVAGTLSGVQVFGEEYGIWGLVAHHFALGATVLSWVVGWIWVPLTASIAVYIPLLFPEGSLRSPRWRFVAVAGGLGVVLFAVGIAFTPGRIENLPSTPNPYGSVGHKALFQAIANLGSVLYATSAAAALVSLFLRFRSAQGDEREQLKWFLSSLAIIVLSLGATIVASTTQGGGGPNQVAGPISFVVIAAFSTMPIAAGIAILRYRLYDIDVVISKAVVYGILAAFVTAVYFAVVVGIGALGSGHAFHGGPIGALATAVVAVAFIPVRRWAGRLANRLVYGKRATPYEVLSRFSEKVAATYSTEDVLPRMAQVLGEATGAARADVWLRVGRELRLAESWPPESGPLPTPVVQIQGDRLPDDVPLPGRVVPVLHHDELLGALSVTKPAGDAFNAAEEKLLADLASQAGLVLRNVRLTAELQAHVEEISRQTVELRASRQRIVAAQDQERRRLERNIHDGAQQHLVALAVRLRIATSLVASDPEKAQAMLEDLRGQAAEALDTLRDLARGIYPPVLADQGLVAALTSQARKFPMPVEVESGPVRRYVPELEAAVYFCCLEAVQNVAKYANASRTVIRLSEVDGELAFEVADDGAGFDMSSGKRGSGLQNMTDRVEALGGSLDITSAPGRGTMVTGRIPVQLASEAAERETGGVQEPAAALAAAQASASRSGPNDDLGM